MHKGNLKIIISGGGTGGHIFPAIAIANALKRRVPSAELLFVGAEGKMEMDKVPAAGYKIIGLPIAGIKRSLSIDNIFFPIKLMKSLLKARSIIQSFSPDVVVGVGGYASGPLLFVANLMNVPSFIQEQNSYPGITNKILSKRAKKICVAYPNMDKFFQKDKVVFTGNPIRKDIAEISIDKNTAAEYFGLNPALPVVLVVGGSQGARSINIAIKAGLSKFDQANVQLLWQTGSKFIEQANDAIYALAPKNKIVASEFIAKMDYAYALATVVVARSGASTVSELCVVGKPSIFVPLPTAAEDHQTKNCMALVEQEAGILVQDSNANEQLVDTAIELVNNPQQREKMIVNIKQLGMPNADNEIASIILESCKI